jgi:endonuclease/exonuclease/phosphatase family metal-dependent hydrolase
VVIGGDTVRIFNVHLQSYKIDPDRYSVIENPGIPRKKDLREYRELAGKYKKAMIKRAAQARLIRTKIKASPHPVIVCGDFNDTPASYAYRQTRGKLRDAFVCSGKGIGNTYVGKLPSFRIDYILHSREMKSTNFKIHRVPYSDHLPVTCEITLQK